MKNASMIHPFSKNECYILNPRFIQPSLSTNAHDTLYSLFIIHKHEEIISIKKITHLAGLKECQHGL